MTSEHEVLRRRSVGGLGQMSTLKCSMTGIRHGGQGLKFRGQGCQTEGQEFQLEAKKSKGGSKRVQGWRGATKREALMWCNGGGGGGSERNEDFWKEVDSLCQSKADCPM
eukprot:1161743-Pelagomonas_calceolata.AAC.2